MEQSNSKVLTALSRAQQKFEAVKRDAENPAFKRGGKVSRYATLESVIESVRPALLEEGLMILQKNIFVNGFFGVETRLIHIASGEYETSQFIAPLEKQNAQGVASILTYARRYEYFTLLGLVSEDDDGNAASGVSHSTQTKQVKKTTIVKATIPPAPTVDKEPPTTIPTAQLATDPTTSTDPTTATPAELAQYIARAKAVSAKLTAAGMQTKGQFAVGAQLVKFVTNKTGYDALPAIPKEKWEAIITKLETAVETNATALIQIIQENQ